MPVPGPVTPSNPQTGGIGRVGSVPPVATPQPILGNLQDWQAALAAYIILLYVTEIDSIAPLGVAVAWGVAVTTFLSGGVFKKLGGS